LLNIQSTEEQSIRLKAFDWLRKQVEIHGDVLPRQILADGFEFEGQRIPLISPQGIFKPRAFQKIPISITTTFSGPYNDSFDQDGLLQYRYRGTDPNHRDKRIKEGQSKINDST